MNCGRPKAPAQDPSRVKGSMAFPFENPEENFELLISPAGFLVRPLSGSSPSLTSGILFLMIPRTEVKFSGRSAQMRVAKTLKVGWSFLKLPKSDSIMRMAAVISGGTWYFFCEASSVSALRFRNFRALFSRSGARNPE